MASEGVNLHRAVPPPDPLRPALVAHHHRAAQRPHRPLRPDHSPDIRALVLTPDHPQLHRRRPRPDPPARTRARGPQGVRRSRRRCSACTHAELEEDAAITKSCATASDPDDVIPEQARRTSSTCWPCCPAPTGSDEVPTLDVPVAVRDPTTTSSTRRSAMPRSTTQRRRDSTSDARPSDPTLPVARSAQGPRQPLLGAAAELPVRAADHRAAPGHRRPARGRRRASTRPGPTTDSQWPDGRLPLAAAPDGRLAGRQGAGQRRPQRSPDPRGRTSTDPTFCRPGSYVERAGPAPAGRVDVGHRSVPTARIVSDLFATLERAGVACHDGQPRARPPIRRVRHARPHRGRGGPQSSSPAGGTTHDAELDELPRPPRRGPPR